MNPSHRKRKRPDNRRQATFQRRPCMEWLEDRRLLTTFVVDSLADGTLEELAGDGKLSLREALVAANTNTSVDGSPAGEEGSVLFEGPRDTVNFADGLAGTIQLQAGALSVSDDLNIYGPGANILSIDAEHRSRVFIISIFTDFRDISLINGKATSDSLDGNGGILHTTRSAYFHRVFLSGGMAEGRGGAVYAPGSATVKYSTIANSTAGAEGGGLYTTSGTRLTSSTITGNHAARGGGIYSTKTLRSLYSTIAGNTAAIEGGGVFLELPTHHRASNTILAGNFLTSGAEDNVAGDILSDMFGQTTHNLLGDPGSSGITEDHASSQINVDWKTVLENDGTRPLLKDNLGPTPTIALIHDGPAIDAGRNPTPTTAEDYDQRSEGFDRVVDGDLDGVPRIDIGAFESHGPVIQTYVVSGDIATEGEASVEFTVGIDRRLESGTLSVEFNTVEGNRDLWGPAFFNDFTPTQRTITFHAGGPLQYVITVPITQDLREETEEFFGGVISNPTQGVVDPARAHALATILDDDEDTADILLSETAVLIAEDGSLTATIDVSLAAPPNDEIELLVIGSHPTVVQDVTSMTFNQDNWNIPQTMTFVGAEDDIDNGERYRNRYRLWSSQDEFYKRIEKTFLVYVDDNDLHGITASPATGDTSESGGTATFSVVLHSDPYGSAFFPITSSDTAEGTVQPAGLTFTPENWNIPQEVTITGVDDTQTDGHIAYQIHIGPGEGLYDYVGMSPPPVDVINTDNELPIYDFGDAPQAGETGFSSSYPTQIDQNGARHRVGELYLGSQVDAEFNGTPDLLAGSASTGDDGLGNDDEDGVWLVSSILAGGSAETLSTFAIQSSLAAKVDGWIDFNRDGDWEDAGEQIFISQAVAQGRNMLSFTVPVTTLPGATYARFRVSSSGGLTPVSLAEDGEVEDYRFEILENTPSTIVEVLAESLGSIQVATRDDVLEIESQGQILFRGPSNAISLRIVGSDAADRLQIFDDNIPLGQRLLFDGGAGQDSIELAGTAHNIDLTHMPAGAITGIEQFDFSGSDSNTITLDNAISSQAQGTVRVKHDANDVIEFSDHWSIDRPKVVDSIFLHSVRFEEATLELENSRAFQNPLDRLDVNADSFVAPNDTLKIINQLNSGAAGSLTAPLELATGSSHAYLDTNGDNFLSPIDALLVINWLNAQAGQGEGESTHTQKTPNVAWQYVPPIEKIKKKFA